MKHLFIYYLLFICLFSAGCQMGSRDEPSVNHKYATIDQFFDDNQVTESSQFIEFERLFFSNTHNRDRIETISSSDNLFNLCGNPLSRFTDKKNFDKDFQHNNTLKQLFNQTCGQLRSLADREMTSEDARKALAYFWAKEQHKHYLKHYKKLLQDPKSKEYRFYAKFEKNEQRETPDNGDGDGDGLSFLSNLPFLFFLLLVILVLLAVTLQHRYPGNILSVSAYKLTTRLFGGSPRKTTERPNEPSTDTRTNKTEKTVQSKHLNQKEMNEIKQLVNSEIKQILGSLNLATRDDLYEIKNEVKKISSKVSPEQIRAIKEIVSNSISEDLEPYRQGIENLQTQYETLANNKNGGKPKQLKLVDTRQDENLDALQEKVKTLTDRVILLERELKNTQNNMASKNPGTLSRQDLADLKARGSSADKLVVTINNRVEDIIRRVEALEKRAKASTAPRETTRRKNDLRDSPPRQTPPKTKNPEPKHTTAPPREVPEQAVFFSAPPSNGLFYGKGISSKFTPFETIYEITVSSSGSKAHFKLVDDPNTIQYALNMVDTYLIPGADMIGDGHYDKDSRLETIEKGELKKEGNNWKIDKKMKIRYS